MSIYRIGNYGEINHLFRTYFHLPIRSFFDGEATFIFKQIKVNIITFDDWLHKQHGEYESNGESMAEIVERIYGKDARMFVEGLI